MNRTPCRHHEVGLFIIKGRIITEMLDKQLRDQWTVVEYIIQYILILYSHIINIVQSHVYYIVNDNPN